VPHKKFNQLQDNTKIDGIALCNFSAEADRAEIQRWGAGESEQNETDSSFDLRQYRLVTQPSQPRNGVYGRVGSSVSEVQIRI
jgi:hypothetical protein